MSMEIGRTAQWTAHIPHDGACITRRRTSP